MPHGTEYVEGPTRFGTLKASISDDGRVMKTADKTVRFVVGVLPHVTATNKELHTQ
jgi:hypothetical protein